MSVHNGDSSSSGHGCKATSSSSLPAPVDPIGTPSDALSTKSVSSSRVRFNLQPMVLTGTEEVSFGNSSRRASQEEELENLCKQESKWSFPAKASSAPPTVTVTSPTLSHQSSHEEIGGQSNRAMEGGDNQMENFLHDYQELQNHLSKMQAACDSLKMSADCATGHVEMDQLKATIGALAGVLEKEVEKALSTGTINVRY